MLGYLRIRGLALLDDVTLELSPGMNVLTGETGAGKSIIVEALSLLRGARGRPELVRQGEEAATVDACFEPGASMWPRLRAAFEEHGVPADEEEQVVLRRVVPRSGRGRSFVQATPTTQAVLSRVGELLVDICSQHEHHFLTHPARHLEVLDAWAKLEGARTEHGRAHRALRDAQDRRQALQERARQAGSRSDYLRFQIDELEAISPQPGEHEALRRRLGLLRDAQRWAEFARDAHVSLYEADDAIASRLGSLLDRARRGGEGSELLAQMQEQLAAAQVACEEAAQAAARFAEELEIEPGELELAEERMHELEGLRRKHGVEVDALADELERMREELASLERVEDDLAGLDDEVGRARDACMGSAKRLHDARVAAAEGLAHAVQAELRILHMPGARLAVQVQAPDPTEPGPTGIDHVQFLFTANPGEPLAPLSRVASGGELSRVLLAIKNALTHEDRVATYVFDEVDAGVGGAVAVAIGRRLKAAAAGHQVLCVTHLPQIAAFADAHYRVDKRTHKGRTITRVARLTDDERVEELARMLGGEAVGPSAREHARQLLADAAGTRIKASKRPAARRKTAAAR
ncbi:DNA repair protein RecN [Paraliomyxa miuraensis]|uniref:DNA repair protein RecN n=1 Tax=Paraliomyxa miuraensis TaxID=376150 RepID=UPI0022567494|nr:DNA repair protein RecN [Paraliomyxa miuraensis]MCX4242277.1 DNA repair protein RecN [Paraliomyxa miuraensis]